MGFKRSDIEPCVICSQGIGIGGIIFYRIRIESLCLDHAAISRQSGLEQMLNGNAAIAQVLGPDSELAQVMNDKTVLVCLSCLMTSSLAEFFESSSRVPADAP